MPATITLRRLFRNYLSLIGGGVAGMSFAVNVFLLFLDFLSPTQNPYVGIITYMILPGVTLTGVGLIFGGAALRFLQLRRGAQVVELPRLDLNNTRHRLVLAGTFLATDSLPGAVGDRRLRELSLHRLGGVLREDLPQRDEPRVHRLPGIAPRPRSLRVLSHRAGGGVVRPGQDFRRLPGLLGDVQQVLASHPDPHRELAPGPGGLRAVPLAGQILGGAACESGPFQFGREEHSRAKSACSIKTGGGSVAGVNAGIHYHMNIQNKIWYAAADHRRQVIPWIQVQGPDGRVTEYLSTEKPFTAEAAQEGRDPPDGLRGLPQPPQPPIPSPEPRVGPFSSRRANSGGSPLHQEGGRGGDGEDAMRPSLRRIGESRRISGTSIRSSIPRWPRGKTRSSRRRSPR